MQSYPTRAEKISNLNRVNERKRGVPLVEIVISKHICLYYIDIFTVPYASAAHSDKKAEL